MNQRWTNRNRSAKELLNRSHTTRVSEHEATNLDEGLAVQQKPKPLSKSATSGSGSTCDCKVPCYNIARNHRALPHCNKEMVRQHFIPLLKPTPELRQVVESLGLIEHTKEPVVIGSSLGCDTVECPNCNCVIDLEVVRAQETLKL